MMMIEKLKALIASDQLADDGSVERAQEYIEFHKDLVEAKALTNNPAFKGLLDGLSREFTTRMMKLTEEDPELKAIRRMFVRTVGKAQTADRIEQDIKSFLESGETN